MSRKEPFGRPTKYKQEYCDMLIKHLEQGLSFDSFGAVANVTRDTLYKWLKKYDDFSDTKKKADLKCLLFWEKLGLIGTTGKRDSQGNKILPEFNVVSWIFNMKNRFGWRDKRDIEHSGNIKSVFDLISTSEDEDSED